MKTSLNKFLAVSALVAASSLTLLESAHAGGRQILGAVIGAGAGSVIGQEIGGREGAIVGAVLGAAIGSTVTARHDPVVVYPHPPQDRVRYERDPWRSQPPPPPARRVEFREWPDMHRDHRRHRDFQDRRGHRDHRDHRDDDSGRVRHF
jgi:Glycine zipper